MFCVKKRSLTTGEKILAKSIFSDQINLDKVEIVAHRLVFPNYAISPNGHIYFHPRDWVEDFSVLSIELQSWLIHELTHVWQFQHGIAVVRKALFDRRYRYVLQEGKTFLQYGIEQQASIVQDYFLRQKYHQACDDLAQCIPFLPNNIS